MATHKELMESDGFVMVGHGGGKPKQSKVKKTPLSTPAATPTRPQGSSVKDALKFSKGKKISKAIEAIKMTILSMENGPVLKIVTDALEEGHLFDVESLVSFGLGSITTSTTSQYQFAFLLLLAKILKLEKIDVFDPIMDEEDIAVLSSFKCAQLPSNTCGKHSSMSKTLYYMPHCPLGLYGNLLLSNWELPRLKNTIIIGNSFSNYDSRRLSNKAENNQYSDSFLFQALPYIKELSLELRSESFGNAFNDQFLHVWMDLPGPEDSFWTHSFLESESEEIVARIENLTL